MLTQVNSIILVLNVYYNDLLFGSIACALKCLEFFFLMQMRLFPNLLNILRKFAWLKLDRNQLSHLIITFTSLCLLIVELISYDKN